MTLIVVGVVALALVVWNVSLERRLDKAEDRASAAREALLEISALRLTQDDDVTIEDLRPFAGFISGVGDAIHDGLAEINRPTARQRWSARTRQSTNVVDIRRQRP